MIRNRIARADLTADYVRSVLKYDPENGSFTWIDPVAYGRRTCGKNAGSAQAARAGYDRKQICINYTRYKSHNIAWLIVTGNWPPKGQTIDHVNKDPSDNRWSNLRLATASQNQANRSKQSNNTSGFKNVSYDPKRKNYQVGIGYRGKRISLGRFNSAEEAHAAYCEAAKKYHGEFARME